MIYSQKKIFKVKVAFFTVEKPHHLYLKTSYVIQISLVNWNFYVDHKIR